MAVETYSEHQINGRSETYGIGYETMVDVIKELQRPGLDPRDELEVPCFKSDVLNIEDVKIGMELEGIVRNVTDFGAFVDIGLHNDGLVHKSQMANHYVTNPTEVVSVGQRVKVRVLDIDLEREKIALTMKDPSAPQAARPSTPRPTQSPATPSQPSRPSRDDDDAPVSTMRGNISFS